MRSSLVSRPAVAVAGAFVLLMPLLLVAFGAVGTQASLSGGMDAMSIDVDVTGNTATSLGPLDSCVEATVGDVVTVDVTALNVPAATAMSGFAYTIQYDETNVWVETQDHQFLLAANVGSGLINASEPTPDLSFNGRWNAAAADLSDWRVVPPEYGSGALSRLSISISQSAPDGVYPLSLTGAGHVDVRSDAWAPDVVNDAVIALGVPCPPVAGTPT